jgi:hypothetical protein
MKLHLNDRFCSLLKWRYFRPELSPSFPARAQAIRGKFELVLIFSALWYGFSRPIRLRLRFA